MKVMSKLADKAYDLAICDPPYQVDMSGGKAPKNGFKSRAHWDKMKVWDAARPDAAYFDELRRVSKNQIIWGGNYFTPHLPPSMGWVFWYKMQDNFSFGDGEFAYTSFNQKSRIFQYARGMESGFAPAGNTGGSQNIHPTQKPVRLYSWLLEKYAKPGDRILDTHMGSGSSVIAALERGFEMLACEIDAEYFATAVERIGRFKQQGVLL
jgi:site-specific DNA-methyltransferase (adenine-specific)